MFKQICLILFVLISEILADSPCGDWLSYKDEKCFKVINLLTTEIQSGSVCQNESGRPALIRSAEEQELVYNYVKNISLPDDLWIGVKTMDNSFKSLDGSSLKYTNWANGRPLNQSMFACVEMSIAENQGKWVDVECEKTNSILCEKDQVNSNSKFEKILQELRKNYLFLKNEFEIQKNQSQSLKNEIAHLKQNPVPIGFIYVQLYGQSEPKTLWPNTQWDNVSKNYAGLFFRAEGGGSNVFGQIQEQQTQSIEFQNERCGKSCKTTIPGDGAFIGNFIKIKNDYPSTTALWTGEDAHEGAHGVGLRFKHNSEEIRPRNQAIRIWIRIK